MTRAARASRCRSGTFALLCAVALSSQVGIATASTPSPGESRAGEPAAAGESDGLPTLESDATAATILAGQPPGVLEKLEKKKTVVMQEVVASGPLSGGAIMAFVIFDQPIDRTYRFLTQTARQTEFRPEVTSIETIEVREHGQIDEHRLRILFRRYVYRIEYELDPEHRAIHWKLDDRFANDLRVVNGFWELYPMEGGRTLGRFGTSVDVGPSVPGFLQDWITRKNLPTAMEQVRLWVDSEGTYRP